MPFPIYTAAAAAADGIHKTIEVNGRVCMCTSYPYISKVKIDTTRLESDRKAQHSVNS